MGASVAVIDMRLQNPDIVFAGIFFQILGV